MAELNTTYLGLQLKSPLVLASSSLSNRVENFQVAEQNGAGAVVLRSLFEEQIEALDSELADMRSQGAESFPEAQSFFPNQSIGPREYLRLCERAKKAVRIPVIGSLNCVAPGSWTGYARQISEAGVDALEVNPYAVRADPTVDAGTIEQRLEDMVAGIVSAVRVPVSVKLSPYFTSLGNVMKRLQGVGVKGFVLFNRFLQPDISVERMSLHNAMALSHPSEMLLSLRWIALMHGRIEADLAASTGIHDTTGVIKQILVGASVVQVASALLKNGVAYLGSMRDGLEDWMDKRGMYELADFRGSMSQKLVQDPAAFERAQYVNLILSQNV